MSCILIIDDERAIRASIRDILEYEGYQVEEAENGIKALEMLKKISVDAILCDIKMPQIDGLEVLKKAQELSDAPIAMISGHATIETAVEALKMGAYDFLEKPVDLNRLLVCVRHALEKKQLVAETRVLKTKIREEDTIVGESPALMAALEMADKVASTDARVLLMGSNGTGKELFARRIHARSTRAQHPMVEVNCAAIPSELIESELFGHEKGAFTSAIKQRKGDFEQADKGTLFLDEIGDMSLSAQAKVLRALQENKITRIGGEKEIQVDVRVIAATNKDLAAEIKAGRFREDLYHRLSVIVVKVPSLNERTEDIPLLCQHFIRQICQRQGKAEMKISPEALRGLQQKNWTGNIRELRNVIERLVILCEKTIQEDDIYLYS